MTTTISHPTANVSTTVPTPLADAANAAIDAAARAEQAWLDDDGDANDSPLLVASRKADADMEAACVALRLSDEPRMYHIRYLDSSGVSTTITCSPAELDAEVEDEVRSGDYSGGEGTQYVDVRVTCIDGTDGQRTIVIDPEAPDCADGKEHDWQSPIELVGGIEPNPGVWGNGGGVKIHEVCAHCGAHRRTDTWAQRMDTGEQGLREVGYAAADAETLAWVAARQADS